MRESSEHAALVELFRGTPELAVLLLRAAPDLGVPVGSCRVVDPVMRPGMLVPDLVIELGESLGKPPSLVIIVEVQRRIDAEKRWTWPAYLWMQRLRRRCPCHLLVVAPDAAVAAWAAQPIHCGEASSTRAVVIGPGQIPRITELEQAEAVPALALLSARAHGLGPDGGAVRRVALAVLNSLKVDDRRVYSELVVGPTTDDPTDHFKEELVLVDTSNLANLYRTPEGTEFARFLLERLQERREAIADQKVLLQALLRVLARRGVVLSAEQEAELRGGTDTQEFYYWLERAATANSAEELFAEPMD